MIPGSANSLLLASAAGAAQYQIERSLRFNSADSAYLSRTPSSAGNRKTWTWAGWVKRSGLDTRQNLFSASTAFPNNQTTIELDSDNTILLNNVNSSSILNALRTSAVYRDVSAWMHIVVACDTTAATDTDRTKLYVNGSQVTAFSSATYPAQNYDTHVNSTAVHSIGLNSPFSVYTFDGYLADIHFIDGQTLTPSSFGYTDSNGIWQPKAYTGTYGTNGFHLDFADNSAATTAGIGKDASGNGNDWTPNNFSVTAGAGNDSLVDTPTNGSQTDTGIGGEVVGNYATLNPLLNGSGTPSDGNLLLTGPSSAWGSRAGTIAISSGKWYFEVTATSGATSQGVMVGITKSLPAGNYLGIDANGYAYFSATGNKWNNGSGTAYGATWTDNDVIGCAFDADAGTLTFYKNGTSQGTAYSSLSSVIWFLGLSCYATATAYINFGQRPFAYPVSGFKALCTTNLPSTTITTSGTYTGNGVADGPVVYLNGVPTAMTVNGNAVTFGTEADKLSNGFKVRTTSTTYNQNAATYSYSITSTGDPFKVARAQSNP